MAAQRSDRAYRPVADTLEGRELKTVAGLRDGVLYAVGTNAAETITIRQTADRISIDGVGWVQASRVRSIMVEVAGGNDVVNLSNGVRVPSVISGGAGDDVLIGGSRSDILSGGPGNDVLAGLGGGDLLLGDAGFDALYGGDGNDILDGGADTDQLRGDAGRDVIVYDDFDARIGRVVTDSGDRLYRNAAVSSLAATRTPTSLFGGQRPSDFFNWGWTSGLSSPGATADWLAGIGLPNAGSLFRRFGAWGR